MNDLTNHRGSEAQGRLGIRARITAALLVPLLLAACATMPAAPPARADAPHPPAALPQGTVVRVVDGDTVDVAIGGEVERVRLIGIDTPETVRPNTPIECFGKQASAFTGQLLGGQTVAIEADPSQDSRDKYGRLLAYLWLADGRMANMELVAGGYAYEYTYDQPYKYQAQFRQAQREAQAAQRGLWAPGACGG